MPQTRKVALAARLKTETGERMVAVQVKKGRPIAPQGQLIGFYIRFWRNDKRKVMPAGKDLAKAFETYQNVELNHARLSRGLAPIEGAAALVRDFEQNARNSARISDVVMTYLRDLNQKVKIGQVSNSTYVGYKSAIEDFRDNCGVTFINEITGDVLKRHVAYLCDTLQKRARGKQLNTVAKRFRYLSTFFSSQGIKLSKDRSNRPGDPGLMSWADVPKEVKKQNIDKYSMEEINGMLKVANTDQADLIQTFLRTGCRDEEIAYLKWSDVDWKRRQITIDEKPEFGWRPKDKEKRVIPLEDGVLLERLAARRKRQSPASNLVFPNTLGSPDMHLIRQLHKIVDKMKEQGLEIEGVPTLHRFRRTYASVMISHSDLQTVSKLLGHSDIETTSRYLAADDSKAREATKTAFQEVGS